MPALLVVLLTWSLLSVLVVAGLAALFTGSAVWQRRALATAAELAQARAAAARPEQARLPLVV